MNSTSCPSSPGVEAVAEARGQVLAVVGGRGGAGASLFAAAVGLTVLSIKETALLVDCDALGGGLDLVLGVAASSLREALPRRTRSEARLTVLSGAGEGAAPEPDAVAAVIEVGRRAGKTVICDLPRTFNDAALAALEQADLTVMIVPAEVRACAAAKILAARLADLGHIAQLVARGPAPGYLRPDEVADAVGLPLLTSMRPEPSVARLIERGEFKLKPENPLAKAARAALRALASKPWGPL
jgi:hypothetical protein